MTKPWHTTIRDRRSKLYADLHRQLEQEVAADKRAESLSHLSHKQRGKFAASELYRIIGETSP